MSKDPDAKTDEAALQARLDTLSKTLGRRGLPADKPKAPKASGDAGFGNAMGAGMRVVTEIVAGVLVGGGIGWLLDKAFNTKPLFMILIGCLGLAGGFWNTIREAMKPTGAKNGR